MDKELLFRCGQPQPYEIHATIRLSVPVNKRFLFKRSSFWLSVVFSFAPELPPPPDTISLCASAS